MDDDSNESTEVNDVTGVGRSESETERLGRGWWRETGSWFQRQGEAYRRERSGEHGLWLTVDSSSCTEKERLGLS